MSLLPVVSKHLGLFLVSSLNDGYQASIHIILILAALEQQPRVLLSSMTEIMGLTKCLHHPTPGLFIHYINQNFKC